jgi:hypothetical protein
MSRSRERWDRSIALRECPKCRESLRLIEVDGREVAFERATGVEHECWGTLPDDAELLVLDDD